MLKWKLKSNRKSMETKKEAAASSIIASIIASIVDIIFWTIILWEQTVAVRIQQQHFTVLSCNHVLYSRPQFRDALNGKICLIHRISKILTHPVLTSLGSLGGNSYLSDGRADFFMNSSGQILTLSWVLKCIPGSPIIMFPTWRAFINNYLYFGLM